MQQETKQNTHKQRQSIHFVRLRDVPRRQKPRFLVDGLIPAEDITVVWGEPKSGKTFWVLDLAFHVALGRPYRGRRVEQGDVAYCVLEGVGAFPDRLEAMVQAYGEETRDAPLWLHFGRLRFGKIAGSNDLIQAILDGPQAPKLVVIDTLNRSLAGSENSDDDMTHYTRCIENLIDTFGCSVIVVHHCGVSKDKPRGHTSLTGTCAAQLKVEKIGRDAEGSAVRTEVEFMKDGPEGYNTFSWIKPRALYINEKGQEVVSCHIIEAQKPEGHFKNKTSTMPTAKERAFTILENLILKSREGKIELSEWREECKLAKLGRNREASRTAFYKMLEKFRSDGTIEIDGKWVSIPSQSTQTKT